ncbi:MAG TPA: exopolysaccharide biosynthesis polyprenyl glycosylphosphotransferase [Pirellulales bacterium]|nr:exopolysaccharide biosynthesis polyprenyl glycosylphosphotransferase [Pirellulales bacterium]
MSPKMKSEQLTALPPPNSRSARMYRSLATLDRAAAQAGRTAVFVSRLLDLVLSLALLCIFSLPMLLIALLVKCTSQGPSIYRQQRSGLHGRPFVMFKFRTMPVDAESQSGPVWSKRGDPRCTRLGSFLRRYSLDELPQLFNVLLGDMSLVGPRPERPYFVQEFLQTVPHYGERLEVLPGITGWAQINGWRGDSSLEKRLECDLYYIKNWSLLFNLRILLATPLRVLVEQHVC